MSMMRFEKIIFGVLVCFAALGEVNAQTDESSSGKEHRWVVYGGIGPNYYFNNLERGEKLVQEFNYSFVARLMWEPEYFVSLGFETGYNRLYSLTGNTPTTGDVRIVNVAIPIQFVVSMKFTKSIYGSFNVGQAILLNKVSTELKGDYNASVVSLGDFAATVGYRKDISERFMMGTELKFYYSGKLEDRNVALLFMTGYRLW